MAKYYTSSECVVDAKLCSPEPLQERMCYPAVGKCSQQATPAVSTFRTHLSCREPPFSRPYPFQGSLHLVLSGELGREVDSNFGSTQATQTRIISLRAPHRTGQGFIRPTLQSDFFLYPILLPTFIHRIIPNKHLGLKTLPQCLLLKHSPCDRVVSSDKKIRQV